MVSVVTVRRSFSADKAACAARIFGYAFNTRKRDLHVDLNNTRLIYLHQFFLPRALTHLPFFIAIIEYPICQPPTSYLHAQYILLTTYPVSSCSTDTICQATMTNTRRAIRIAIRRSLAPPMALTTTTLVSIYILTMITLRFWIPGVP